MHRVQVPPWLKYKAKIAQFAGLKSRMMHKNALEYNILDKITQIFSAKEACPLLPRPYPL